MFNTPKANIRKNGKKDHTSGREADPIYPSMSPPYR